MTETDQKQRIVIRAGRIFCAASGVNGAGTVVINGDRIESVTIGSDDGTPRSMPPVDNEQVLEFPDGILLPGLVDLHAHPALAGSVFGVSPDETMLTRGVTTVLSQGDAGAFNVDSYVEKTISKSRMRVLLAINLSRIGESTPQGCFEEIEDANVDETVAAVTRHSEHIRAIAVNTSHLACGKTDPREILRRGIVAATETGLPLLYGMRRPEDWPLSEQLALLRQGDIVTYCFRREPHCIVSDQRVLSCVGEARKNGIRFDIGHGMWSFNFDVATTAVNDGFSPDTISTDLQSKHLGLSPPHDLPLVMSKLRAVGMSENDILAAVTATPADILNSNNESGIVPASGVLLPGNQADLVVLDSVPDQTLYDVSGQSRVGTLWTPRLTVVAGEMVLPS